MVYWDRIIGVVALIAVLLIGAYAITLNNNPSQVTAADYKGTKLAFTNNGTTWLHMDVILENVTLKNGKKETFYSELYLKPKTGTIVMDLSKFLGYGNKQLPAGTTIRILAWKGLLNPTAGGTGDLNLTMQGWSNTQFPGTEDKKLEIFFGGMSINQLPQGINGDVIFTAEDINKLHKLQGFVDDEENEPLYEEEILTVDANGRVTITPVVAPELCEQIAHLI